MVIFFCYVLTEFASNESFIVFGPFGLILQKRQRGVPHLPFLRISAEITQGADRGSQVRMGNPRWEVLYGNARLGKVTLALLKELLEKTSHLNVMSL